MMSRANHPACTCNNSVIHAPYCPLSGGPANGPFTGQWQPVIDTNSVTYLQGHKDGVEAVMKLLGVANDSK